MRNLIISLLTAFLCFNGTSLAANGEEKIFTVEEAIEDDFLEVAKDLRCPTCTGLSVLESNADFSVQIKSIVAEKVKEGASKDEILGYFTERYGAWILREPPKEGFNLVAWAFPIALMVLGPIFVYAVFWRKKQVVLSNPVRSTDVIVQEMEDKLTGLRGAQNG